MKKLVEFIKNLFVKVDKIEQEVEQMVEKSDVSPAVKAKVKKALKKIDAVEEQAKEAVIDDAEKVEVAVEVVKKKKRYYRPKKK
jgi:biopolymer transport protein ExbB/TolQ